MNKDSLQLVNYDNHLIPSGYLMGEISAEFTLTYLKSLGAPQSSLDKVKEIEVSKLIYKAVLKKVDTGGASSRFHQSYVAKGPDGRVYGQGHGPIPPSVMASFHRNNKPPEGWEIQLSSDSNDAGSISNKAMSQYRQQKVVFYTDKVTGDPMYVMESEGVPRGVKVLGKKTIGQIYDIISKHNEEKKRKELQPQETAPTKEQATIENTPVDTQWADASTTLEVTKGGRPNVLANIVVSLRKMGKFHQDQELYDFLQGDRESLEINFKNMFPELTKDQLSELKDALDTEDDLSKVLDKLKTLDYVTFTDESKSLTTGNAVLDRRAGLDVIPVLEDTFKDAALVHAILDDTTTRHRISMMLPAYVEHILQNKEAFEKDEDAFLENMPNTVLRFSNPVADPAKRTDAILALVDAMHQQSLDYTEVSTKVLRSKKYKIAKLAELATLNSALVKLAKQSTSRAGFREVLVERLTRGVEGNAANEIVALIDSKFTERFTVSDEIFIELKKYSVERATGVLSLEDSADMVKSSEKILSPNARKILGLMAKDVLVHESRNDESKVWPHKGKRGRNEEGEEANRTVNLIRDSYENIAVTSQEVAAFKERSTGMFWVMQLMSRNYEGNSVSSQGIVTSANAVNFLQKKLGEDCKIKVEDFSGVFKCTPLQIHLDPSTGRSYLCCVTKDAKVKTLSVDGTTSKESIKEFVQDIQDEIVAGRESGNLVFASERAFLSSMLITNPSLVMSNKIKAGGVSNVEHLASYSNQKLVASGVNDLVAFYGREFGDVVFCRLGGAGKGRVEINETGIIDDPELTKKAFQREIIPNNLPLVEKMYADVPALHGIISLYANKDLLKAVVTGQITDISQHPEVLQALSTPGADGEPVPLSNRTIGMINAVVKDAREGKAKLDKLKEDFSVSDGLPLEVTKVPEGAVAMYDAAPHLLDEALQSAFEGRDIPEDVQKVLQTGSTAEKIAVVSLENKKKLTEEYFYHVMNISAQDELTRMKNAAVNSDPKKRTRVSIQKPSNTFEAVGMLAPLHQTLLDAGPIVEPVGEGNLFHKRTLDSNSLDDIDKLLDTGVKFTTADGKAISVGMRPPPPDASISGEYCDGMILTHDIRTSNVSFSPCEFKWTSSDTQAHYNAVRQSVDVVSRIGKMVALKGGTLTVNPTFNFVTNSLSRDTSGDTVSGSYPLSFQFKNTVGSTIGSSKQHNEGISGEGVKR